MVFCPPSEEYARQSGSFSQIRGKNQKCLKPPPSSTWNAKCPIFLGNFTPKTRNYCLKNRVLGFPGRYDSTFRLPWLNTGKTKNTQPGPHEAPHQHLEHPLKTGDWHADAFLVLPKALFFPQKKVCFETTWKSMGPGSPKLEAWMMLLLLLLSLLLLAQNIFCVQVHTINNSKGTILGGSSHLVTG